MNEPAFDYIPGKARASDAGCALLFLCDHASNALPEHYGTLGLPNDALAMHIAYDPGAAELTRGLADAFGAPAFLGCWSRLLADLNRGPDDPTLVMKLSDRKIILGNAALTPEECTLRLTHFHAPYHEAISAEIARLTETGCVPVIVSIHSFTPLWRGQKRPWHVAILSDRDRRLAGPLLERLARETDLVVGDNEPYSGALEGDSLSHHGTAHGLPHVLIETRQDLLSDPPAIAHWTRRLEAVLRDALATMGPPTILPPEQRSRPNG
jgi:predicted N-formylglutamate amidohydrolase